MKTPNELLNDLKIVNYKTFRGHDGEGFNLELMYKGKKIATVDDDGWGGGYQVEVIGGLIETADSFKDDKLRTENKALMKELDSRISKLPKRRNEDLKMDFEANIEDLVDELINRKNLEKDGKKGVVVKTTNGWKLVGYKMAISTLVKKYKNGLELLQNLYNEKKSEGCEILNLDYLKSVGVKL